MNTIDTIMMEMLGGALSDEEKAQCKREGMSPWTIFVKNYKTGLPKGKEFNMKECKEAYANVVRLIINKREQLKE